MTKKEKFISNFIGSTHKSELTTALAQQAIDAIAMLEIPTTKDEYWKYTRLGKIVNANYNQETTTKINTINQFILPFEVNLLVFINGIYSVEYSTSIDKNIIVKSLVDAKKENAELVEKHIAKYADHNTQLFTALNTAYSTNGCFVHVPKNTKIKHPIHLLNLTTGENIATNPRNLFVLEQGSEAIIINSFETIDGSSFINTVSEIVLEENSKIELLIIQNQNTTSKQINTTEVYQKSNSIFSSGTFTFSGELIRNNLNVSIDGTGCETNLNGLYLTTGNQHVDNHTYVNHKQPNCESNELYKGILNDNSSGVFNGKVFVNSIAQKTNAFQQNQNILLSDNANAYSKPELEIYADDVKCSHGSTTGQFDEDAVFYLRSRGISENSAKKLLVEAFASDVLDIVSVVELRSLLEEQIHKNLK